MTGIWSISRIAMYLNFSDEIRQLTIKLSRWVQIALKYLTRYWTSASRSDLLFRKVSKITINLEALNKRLYLYVRLSISLAIGASGEVKGIASVVRLSLFRQALRSGTIGFETPSRTRWNGFRRLGSRRKTSSASRRHRRLANARPMINDHAFDISLSFFTHRWDPLIFPSSRTTYSPSYTAVVHFPETTGAAKTRQLHYYTMRRGREGIKRETQKGGMEICRYRYAFWWSAKNRKRGLSLTYQCYRLAGSQLFIARLAMAEDLRSTPHRSWIHSRAGRGEVRKYADFNGEIFVRIRTTVALASFAGSSARATWCKEYVMYSRYYRCERIQFGEFPKTIHFRTEFLSTLEIHVQTAFAFGLNNWSTRQLIYCRCQNRISLNLIKPK